MGERPTPNHSSRLLHEVTSSLTVIVGYAQLFERKLKRGLPVTSGEMFAALGLMQRRGRKAAHEIRQLQERRQQAERHR